MGSLEQAQALLQRPPLSRGRAPTSSPHISEPYSAATPQLGTAADSWNADNAAALAGVMIGRAAFFRPWEVLARADLLLGACCNAPTIC